MMIRIRCLLTLLSVALAVTTCSHQVESPQPTGSRMEPDLVCNQAPVGRTHSTVVVHGSNLRPMPTKVLEGDGAARLVLPSIEITQVRDLAGSAASASSIRIADDPSNPGASSVRWYSEQQMSFDVRPEPRIPEGVYSLKITNPDGKAATSIEAGLGVIPPPVVGQLNPPAICDDQSDQTIQVIGTNFLKIGDVLPSVTLTPPAESSLTSKSYTPTRADGCVAVVGNFVEPSVELCTSLTIVVKQGDFVVSQSTALTVVVTNPPPADCASSASATLRINPPPSVNNVNPETVCEGGASVTIHGGNFQDGATVELLCEGQRTLRAVSTNASDDGTTLSAVFGPGAPVGARCDVVVTNPDGCQDRPPHQDVTVVSGPILFYVDPSVVYNGIGTQVTLYVTTISPPLQPDAVTIVPTGQSEPVTVLEHSPVPNHPNRLQALVPAGQAAGTYDVRVADGSGCYTVLPAGLVVAADTSVTVDSIVPTFGWTEEDTAVEISGGPFVQTPRVFLNPTAPQAGDLAVELEGITFRSSTKVTGVVPRGTPVRRYHVVVVNPDGTVGLLSDGFTEVADAPPVITDATPASIAAADDQSVLLWGRYFDANATVTLECRDAQGAVRAAPSVTSQAATCDTNANCTMQISIDAGGLVAGDVCVAKLTNADGSYALYSAIGVTTPSLNINDPRRGTPMNVARRAPAAAAGKATPAARFVYALGGDNGQTSSALASIEFAPVGLFGDMAGWTAQPYALGSARTLAGAVTLGRYIYVVGGDGGSGPMASVERALILSPRETPRIQDVDLELGEVGLSEGEWHYRVSAQFAPNDPNNPAGESLASDPFSLRLPNILNKKIAVELVWSAPVDSLGAPLAGVVGYRVFRTPAANQASGTEVLLATIDDPSVLTFRDEGTQTPGTESPLPLGATGKWSSLPTLGTPREGHAMATAVDPADPTTLYVYALFGKDSTASVTNGYEYLAVSVQPNGDQLVAGAWLAGQEVTASPRWQAGGWTVDSVVTSLVSAPDTYIYVGGGLNSASGPVDEVEAALVGEGGELGVFDTVPEDFRTSNAGYGAFAGNGQLFTFGGGPTPTDVVRSGVIIEPPPTLRSNSWNTSVHMIDPRYLPGCAVQSAFVFLVGGQTTEASAAPTTEMIVW